MLGKVAAGTGDAGVVRSRCVERYVIRAEHKLFAAQAGTAVGQMIQRGVDVVERPLTTFDQPPEIGRRQRIGDDVGIRIAFLLAKLLGVGA